MFTKIDIFTCYFHYKKDLKDYFRSYGFTKKNLEIYYKSIKIIFYIRQKKRILIIFGIL